jgi:hypothetical protein
VWLVVLVGCGRIGFDPEATPPLPPPDDAVTEFPGAHADPSLLPPATGQTEAATAPGAALDAKDSYTDPVSGVRVWKLTSDSFPVANIGAYSDREYAGAVVSAAYLDDKHTIVVELDLGGGVRRRHLIELQRTQGVSADQTLTVQGAEDAIAFTADPTDPRVLFTTDSGNRLHRIDTTTNTVEDGTLFPIADVSSTPSLSAAGRTLLARTPGGLVALNTITGERSAIAASNAIHALDHDGLFALERNASGPGQLWRIGEASTSGWLPPTGDFAAAVGVSGGFVAIDVDSGPPMELYFSDPLTRTHSRFGTVPGYDSVALASQWIQTDVPTDQQWVLYATFEQGFPMTGPLDDAVGFLRLDGEFRFLLHHYGPDNAGFYELPRASLSPDGRIVVFTSTMGTNRTDVYAAEVPLSQ